MISPNISIGEIACRCGCGFAKLDPAIASAFERIRAEVSRLNGNDTPIRISSGCRCMQYNTAIGGAVNSQHIYGKALDLVIPAGWTKEEFYIICNKYVGSQGGVGYYNKKNIIHIDGRGEYARWRQ